MYRGNYEFDVDENGSLKNSAYNLELLRKLWLDRANIEKRAQRLTVDRHAGREQHVRAARQISLRPARERVARVGFRPIKLDDVSPWQGDCDRAEQRDR